MHRIKRRDLSIHLAVAIKIALGRCKPLLRPNRLPHESDELANTLAEAALNVVDGDSRMVIQTEIYAAATHGGRHGKWGVDEPVPALGEASDVQPFSE